MPRTFVSEEERQAALDALPETPSDHGVDVDLWQEEQGVARDEILSAEIVPEGAPQEPPPGQEPEPKPAPVEPEPAQEPQAPVPPAQEPQPAPAPEPSGEGEFYFTLPDGTKIRKEDLPEELQGYADPREVLKQFGHARKYANAAEARITAMTEEFQKAQEEQRRLKDEVDALKKGPQMQSPTAVPGAPGYGPTAVQAPMPPQAMPADQSAAIQTMISEIDSMEEDPLADQGQQKKLKSTLKTLATSLGAVYQENAVLQTKVSQQQQEFNQQLEAVSGDAKAQKDLLERWKTESDTKKTAAAVTTEVQSLQSRFPELQTSKHVFSLDGNGGAVESAAWSFANKVLMLKRGSPPRGWDEVNALVNQYNREDTELVAFCQNSGVSPQDAGITATDLQSYATIVNAYNMVQGKRYNEFTGQLEQMTNSFGKPVNFPSMDAAYQYMLSQGGITKKRQEEALAAAELLGEKKLESAMQKASTSAKPIGSDGSASPESAGEDMTAEQAQAVLDGIDVAAMVQQGLNGDRSIWNRYVKAHAVATGERLKVPDDWPAVPQQPSVPA